MSNDLIENKIKDHEKRIEKLEDTYSTLKTMNYRLGCVEDSIKGMGDKLDEALTKQINEKSHKWDKLIDYIFYFVVATILGYVAIKLGLK